MTTVGDGQLFLSNSENTGFDVKRLMGCILNGIKESRSIVKEKNGTPMITVKYKHEMREFVCCICLLLSFQPLIHPFLLIDLEGDSLSV